MSRAIGLTLAVLSGFGALPAIAAPPITLGTCDVSISATTGKHGMVSAKIACDHAKHILQANIIAEWPKKHHATSGHYCASPPPYLPACTTDSTTLKLSNLRHYSYRIAFEIIGEDAEFTAVTGLPATDCTTTSTTEIDCYYNGKK